MYCVSVSVLLVGLFLVLLHQGDTCNEAVCGSVVSKCLLTQSCKCDLESCSCCKECFTCLSYLYSECCSCVDMCPKPNETENLLSKKSHVEDLTEKVAGLFKVLTEEQDHLNRWTSITFPVDFNFTHIGVKKETRLMLHESVDHTVDSIKPNIITLNCTVAFMAQCMSYSKCKSMCQSMGATSYRWFHDGCCECIGEHCINYGINESRCRDCPKRDILDEIEDDDDDDFDDEDNMALEEDEHYDNNY